MMLRFLATGLAHCALVLALARLCRAQESARAGAASASASVRTWGSGTTQRRWVDSCTNGAVGAALDDLRGRAAETHGSLWTSISGGGFGNELNGLLSSVSLALALNRSAHVEHAASRTAPLFQPGGGVEFFYADALARGLPAASSVVLLTGQPSNLPQLDAGLEKRVLGFLRKIAGDRAAAKVSFETVLSCLAAELLRPTSVLEDALRAYLRGPAETVVGIHLRTTDGAMAQYMGNGPHHRFGGIRQTNAAGSETGRRLGLDYTGTARKKMGCLIGDFRFGGCLAALARTLQNATFFVAGDERSAVDAVKAIVASARPNATILETAGAAVHTGREDHKLDASRTHRSGHAEGVIKALVDFLMLVYADVFLSNCPDGGSTFAANVHLLRLGGTNFFKAESLCKSYPAQPARGL
ncbi:hypothetical protein M885DRAFT_558513 [Pelagophyceae sp. CCMP2097]|nr:hypothetical protein M885DRAFT_558513 [Pelagophyceae sp. CCMP2097]